MNNRRTLLRHLGGLTALGTFGGLSSWLGSEAISSAQASDYRALVCVYLTGGCDGNDVLVPIDAAYNDYATARGELALAKAELAQLSGASLGHSFGVNPGLAPLTSTYDQGRLAFIANIGPLVRPVTVEQVLQGGADIPPFLLSHSDQTAMQQGWGADEDQSGWGGRTLEALSAEYQGTLSAISLSNETTFVRGKTSRFTRTSPGGRRYWGPADLSQPERFDTRALTRIAQLQSANPYDAEYSRTMLGALKDEQEIQSLLQYAVEPAGNFPDTDLGRQLRFIAQLMPVCKAQGKRRQLFLVSWGQFDTHSNQRGTGERAQDSQLAELGLALAAFDQSVRASGLDSNVITFTLSDFGRTLQPASGAGTDHAWGSHHIIFGGPVRGGQVYGQFPSLVLGGRDDGDPDREGRWVPAVATDQLGATLSSWLGLPGQSIPSVFPNLVNFPSATLPILG